MNKIRKAHFTGILHFICLVRKLISIENKKKKETHATFPQVAPSNRQKPIKTR